MDISTNTRETTAARLRSAYVNGPIEPLRDLLAPNDSDGAYAVQAINTRFWTDAGRRIVGYKIGLTSAAVQKQLGVNQPDFGILFDNMLVLDGGQLSYSALLQGKVEAEIALVLGQDIKKTDVLYTDVLAATAYVLPALEVVDSRIADWKISYSDTVADNASSAFFVLGAEPRSLNGLDLRACGMTMELNGRVVSTGNGAACLGNPLYAAAWLATTLAKRGVFMRAGDIIMTGALGPMVSLPKTAQVSATISGLGSVNFYCS